MAELSTLGSVIKTAYESEPNTNAFTDADNAKLGGISQLAMTGSFNDLIDVPRFVELDAAGVIPSQYINISTLTFKGGWDATTNLPTLSDGTGTTGDFYKVTVAGTHDFGSGSYTLSVGDWVMYANDVWQSFGSNESVISVNGKAGVVVLSAADIGARPSSYVPTWDEVTDKPDFDNLYTPKNQHGNIGSAISAMQRYASTPQSILPRGTSSVIFSGLVLDPFNMNYLPSEFIIPAWARYIRVTSCVKFSYLPTTQYIASGIRYGNKVLVSGVCYGTGTNTYPSVNLRTGIVPIIPESRVAVTLFHTGSSALNVRAGDETFVYIELFE